MRTLGHDQVTIYDEFTRGMIDRFERRDLEISFRELAHVKQTRTPKDYISEIQSLDVMLTNISKYWFILLFIQVLKEPIALSIVGFKIP